MPRSRLRQKRVLVVDDNVDGARSLALLLRNMGHDVSVAHEGRAALELARITQPEVVFLDLVLPDLDGHEIARRLREELGAGIRLFALTGFAADEDRRRSLEAGFDNHLVKPIAPQFLESLLG